jgi:hypothetical protein
MIGSSFAIIMEVGRPMRDNWSSSFLIISQVGRPIMDSWVKFCNNNASW